VRRGGGPGRLDGPYRMSPGTPGRTEETLGSHCEERFFVRQEDGGLRMIPAEGVAARPFDYTQGKHGGRPYEKGRAPRL